MNFNKFWKLLQNELQHEKEFKTLKQKKKFNAHFEQNRDGVLVLKIITETGEPRGSIPSNEFEGVWDNVKGRSRETRFLNENRRLEPYPKKKGGIGKSMQVSYIIALIDYVVQDQNMK
jgi:hypothetical protein